MFKHILIPIDGSRLAGKAVKAGVKFAKELGARVTFHHAIDVTAAFAAGEFVTSSVIEQIETGSHKQALKRLAEAAKVAQAASVPCENGVARQGRAGVARAGERDAKGPGPLEDSGPGVSLTHRAAGRRRVSFRAASGGTSARCT